MLVFDIKGIRCRVSLLFPALLTALLLYQPHSLTISCLLASLIHEGGHLLAMLLCRVPPTECMLGIFGLRLQMHPHCKGYGLDVWVALAGPLANGCAAVVLLWAGSVQAAAVHCLLAALNLLPMTLLDGGVLLHTALRVCGLQAGADGVLKVTTAVSWGMVFALGLCLFFGCGGNPTLLIVAAYLMVGTFLLNKNEKTS